MPARSRPCTRTAGGATTVGPGADTFLDGDVLTERLAFWTARLGEQPADRFTIVAVESGSLAGFAHLGPRQGPDLGRVSRQPAHRPLPPASGARDPADGAHRPGGHRAAPLLGALPLGPGAERPGPALLRGAGWKARRSGPRPPAGRRSEPHLWVVTKLRYVWPDPSRLLITDEEEGDSARLDGALPLAGRAGEGGVLAPVDDLLSRRRVAERQVGEPRVPALRWGPRPPGLPAPPSTARRSPGG
jgi:hypothetical protein